MAANIGIKIANGEFYPLLEENSLIKKRLILTTVHDNQPSVQIDLYRSALNTMTDAQYIGSLVVEKIKPKSKGDPSIEMVISSNSNGDIMADAIDLDTSAGGEHYTLAVSLKSLDETSRDMEIPDFELEPNDAPPSGLYRHAEKIRHRKQSRSFTWLFILIAVIVVLGLLAVWLFYFGGLDTVRSWICGKNTTQTVQTVTPRQPDPVSEPARQAEPVVEAPPVIQAPAVAPAPVPQTMRIRPTAPVYSFNVPATIPREGVNYTIRWGDTLWDIAAAFYRDPWQYRRIAAHNNIPNPNYIISGRTIRIPPRN
uniref:LysM domain protein n=1 Tax=uncultured bacterium contig00053 TaxID=1181537 RepID=A0A806KFJ8_9BACT|nr:LysM domain protein [uncultured bacterium contig00053]